MYDYDDDYDDSGFDEQEGEGKVEVIVEEPESESDLDSSEVSQLSMVSYIRPVPPVHTGFILFSPPRMVDPIKYDRPDCWDFVRRPLQTAGASLDKDIFLKSVLDALVPSRCWEQNGAVWQQHLSWEQPSRRQIASLGQVLDTELVQQQARFSGICNVRTRLHDDLFVELIRQVILDCPERGMLLMRIRDELLYMRDALEYLFTNGTIFGMKMSTEAHNEKQMWLDMAVELEEKNKILRITARDMKYEQDRIKRRVEEELIVYKENNRLQLTAISKMNRRLQEQIDQLF